MDIRKLPLQTVQIIHKCDRSFKSVIEIVITQFSNTPKSIY